MGNGPVLACQERGPYLQSGGSKDNQLRPKGDDPGLAAPSQIAPRVELGGLKGHL
jgi:hypothetical protein